LLPQMSYTEPAVLQAILALASAHRHDSDIGGFRDIEKFTLQAYCKSIQYLRPPSKSRMGASLQVTLITCVLFVCLEILQRRQHTAIFHLTNGLNLIEQNNGALSIVTHATHTKLLDDLIVQMFLRLSLQVNMLGHGRTRTAFLDQVGYKSLPDQFTSTGEARQHLDMLSGRTFALGDLIQEMEITSVGLGDGLLRRRAILQDNLHSWLQIFAKSEFTKKASEIGDRAACLVLRMNHTMLSIVADTCCTPYQEEAFDDHLPRFLSIIGCAIGILHIVATVSVLPEAPSGKPGSLIDIAWVPALFYTASKCRFLRVRMHAIRLLEHANHREGFWDSQSSAQIARELVRLEEEDFAHHPTASEDFDLLQMPLREELTCRPPTGLHRVHYVKISLPNEANGRYELTCRKRRPDGDWQDIRLEYNPATESWTGTGWYYGRSKRQTQASCRCQTKITGNQCTVARRGFWT
jgi:hypothetical protein